MVFFDTDRRRAPSFFADAFFADAFFADGFLAVGFLADAAVPGAAFLLEVACPAAAFFLASSFFLTSAISFTISRSTSPAFFATALPALASRAFTAGISAFTRRPRSTAPFSSDSSIAIRRAFRPDFFRGAVLPAAAFALGEALLAAAFLVLDFVFLVGVLVLAMIVSVSRPRELDIVQIPPLSHEKSSSLGPHRDNRQVAAGGSGIRIARGLAPPVGRVVRIWYDPGVPGPAR